MPQYLFSTQLKTEICPYARIPPTQARVAPPWQSEPTGVPTVIQGVSSSWHGLDLLSRRGYRYLVSTIGVACDSGTNLRRAPEGWMLARKPKAPDLSWSETRSLTLTQQP